MPVLSWEQAIIEFARTWPRDGPLFIFMYSISDLSITIYFILAALIFTIWRLGWRSVVTPMVFSLVSIFLAEIVSRRIVKPLVMRPRPDYLGLDCHANACWGFVSSHATNLFAAAVFLSLYDRRNATWTIPIAVLVAFSRIYLVDHFPLDVIGGSVVGAILGILVWLIYKKLRPWVQLHFAQTRTHQN